MKIENFFGRHFDPFNKRIRQKYLASFFSSKFATYQSLNLRDSTITRAVSKIQALTLAMANLKLTRNCSEFTNS